MKSIYPFLFALAVSLGALSYSATAQVPPGTRLFNAVGTHQCQSKSNIGYKCEVRGRFTSCDEAAKSLALQQCCGRGPEEGGSSIGFTMGSCSPFTFPSAPKN